MHIRSDNSNIGIRHLRAVLAVARERSFVAAAARLGVAPSALTETIKQVETGTGVILFNRKSRPVSPTAAGAAFIVDCERVVALHDGAISGLKRIGGLERGSVSVAAAPSLVDRLVAPAIDVFRRSHPDIGILVADDVAGRVEAMVANGEVDFGVAASWRVNAELEATPIGRDRLGFVCHAAHAFAARSAVAIAEIDPLSIISLSPETGIAQMLANAPEIPAALLHGRLQAHGTISQIMMVRNNLGVALLPEYAAHAVGTAGLCFIPLSDVDVWRTLYMFKLSRKVLSPSARVLFECVAMEAGRSLG